MLTARITIARLAAVASLGSGIVRAAVVPDHASVWRVLVALAAFQIVWGAAVLAWHRPSSTAAASAAP